MVDRNLDSYVLYGNDRPQRMRYNKTKLLYILGLQPKLLACLYKQCYTVDSRYLELAYLE